MTLGLALLTTALYTAPDQSFTIPVPAGWRARAAGPLTVLEPVNGGEERIVVGTGVALARTIQELSQHAAGLTAQFLPGAMISSTPLFTGRQTAEQEYQTPMGLAAWNGMRLHGEFYFAVLAIARPAQLAAARARAKTMFEGARFDGVPRNTALERQLIGSWVKSDNRTTNTGVRDKLMYMSNWSLIFAPGNRFQSDKESFVDTTSEVYGGGNVGAANRHTGTYRIFGPTLVADVEGYGRVLYALETYPNSAGIKLNGMLFIRQ